MNPLTELFREPEKNYINLFTLSPQPMWVYNVKTLEFLDVNDAAVRHYGYTREEFLSMTIREIRPPQEMHALDKALDIARTNSPTSTSGIFRHQKKNGEIIDVQIQSNFLDFLDGNAELVLIHDITSILRSEHEVQQSKEELLKSERRFKALVQEGSELTAILNIEGVFQFVSENYRNIIGHEPEDLLGKNVLEFIHPDDHTRIQGLLGCILTLKQIRIDAFRFRNGDGEWRWVTTTATNLLDDPSVLGIVVNSRDVTDSINQSIELKLSIERYKLILKASDEAFCDWDIENDIVDWGSGFHDIFGYDLSLYNNTLLSDNIHEDDKERVKKEVQEAIDDPTKEIYYSEYRYYKANREVINIQHRGIFLRNAAGKAIRSVDTLKDITPHIQRVERIERQNQQLKQIAWSQSHNVRGPLARVIALADLLHLETGVSEEYKEMVRHLADSAAELDEAIKGIIKKTE
jgi:PAS domain S-box-containing protein